MMQSVSSPLTDNALGKSNRIQHKLSSDPTLIKGKAVRSESKMTVRLQSNGSHNACVLMSHPTRVTRTHSLSFLPLSPLSSSAIPGDGETLPTVEKRSFRFEPHYSRVFPQPLGREKGFHQSAFLILLQP